MKQKDFIVNFIIAHMAAKDSTAEQALEAAELACRQLLKIDAFNKLLEADAELAKNRAINDARKKALETA